uniref:Uncharacterized protein n=1 Tax=Cannabis sativa TaxID=3483 RepID=A0A803Q0R1_CANSA
MLHCTPTTAPALEALIDASIPLPAASPSPSVMGEDGEVFPNRYDPYEAAPATRISAGIICIDDSESQGEILMIEARPAGVECGKRKRNPPIWFNDYTEIKKKQRPPLTFDPLVPLDERLLDIF